MQQILFDLLSKTIFYPDLCEGLEKIESMLELIKEEQPVAYHRRVDLLFSTILMWARDQILRPIGGTQFFFREQPPSAIRFSLPALDQTVQEARSAFQRNMKLSVCLEKCLLACHK